MEELEHYSRNFNHVKRRFFACVKMIGDDSTVKAYFFGMEFNGGKLFLAIQNEVHEA